MVNWLLNRKQKKLTTMH